MSACSSSAAWQRRYVNSLRRSTTMPSPLIRRGMYPQLTMHDRFRAVVTNHDPRACPPGAPIGRSARRTRRGANEHEPRSDEEYRGEHTENHPVRDGRLRASPAVGREQRRPELRTALRENPARTEVVSDRLERPTRRDDRAETAPGARHHGDGKD